MKYALQLQKGGSTIEWLYDTTDNIIYDNVGVDRKCVHTEDKLQLLGISPEIINNKLRLFLSFGSECNYFCEYCSQHPIKTVPISCDMSYNELNIFVQTLTNFIKHNFPDITGINLSFWGGEPLLHYEKIKILVPLLQDSFSYLETINLGLCTNGSLLTDEISAWIVSNKIGLIISYDGPGQYARNAVNIFDNNSNIKNLVLNINKYQSVGLSTIFHKYNPSTENFFEHIYNTFSNTQFNYIELNYIRIHDQHSLNFTIPDLELHKDCSFRIASALGLVTNPYTFFIQKRTINAIYNNLGKNIAWSRCYCSNINKYLCIDLSGNIWACHNHVGQLISPGNELMLTGNIYTNCFTKTISNNFISQYNNKCRNCILSAVCGGGCYIFNPEYTNINCKLRYFEYFPVFSNMLYILSNGYQLTKYNTV